MVHRYLHSQNASSLGDNLTWFLEYVFPLEFPSHTSKPASANRKPVNKHERLVTTSILNTMLINAQIVLGLYEHNPCVPPGKIHLHNVNISWKHLYTDLTEVHILKTESDVNYEVDKYKFFKFANMCVYMLKTKVKQPCRHTVHELE